MTASIDISMHNYRCEGAYLECMIRIAQSLFPKIDISLGDFLQRINYRVLGHPDFTNTCSEGAAEALAMEEGDKWLYRNGPILEALVGEGTVANVKRWCDWSSDGDVRDLKKYYTQFVNQHSDLQTAMDSDIDRLLKYRRVACTKNERVRLSEYLLEEIAVYHLQGERDLLVHIYPGGELQILKALRAHPCALPAIKHHDFIYIYARPSDSFPQL